jgi:hypothetical protein
MVRARKWAEKAVAMADHGRTQTRRIALATWTAIALATVLMPCGAQSQTTFNILDYAPAGSKVDQDGVADASAALAAAIAAANARTAKGLPACVYVPPGIYRIVSNPPAFARAGCIKGEGPAVSIFKLDERFAGDLFVWSEAWVLTTQGASARGLMIQGSRKAPAQQNALVFYDRNDEILLEDIEVDDLPGRAIYSGKARNTPQGYIREAHFHSLRFFNDGAPGAPVVEFLSEGKGVKEATNQIQIGQLDIYGAKGPSLVIRNAGEGALRAISIQQLRIEGTENGATAADLLTIGDPGMAGRVNTISISQLELVDPYRDYAALRLTAPPGGPAPYGIIVSGRISGGLPHGEGLRIDSGRFSRFTFSEIHTEGPNVVIGPHVSQIVLDGGGAESGWTMHIDPTSARGVSFPVFRTGPP